MTWLKMKKTSISQKAWILSSFFIIILALLITTLFLSQKDRTNQEYMLNVLSSTYMDLYQLGGTSAIAEKISDTFYNSYCLVIDKNKNILYSNATQWKVPDNYTLGLHYHEVKQNNEVIKYRYLVRELSDKNLLLVVQNITEVMDAHSDGPWVIIIILGSLSLAGIGSMFIGFYIYKSLININKTCSDIMATGDLNTRIQHGGSGKDFDELAENVNLMLDKIQKLMSDVRQVSDNIAHDLRTPLTRMRNKLDSLDEKFNHDKTALAAVNALQAEADNLLNVFNALLRITNIESGQRHSFFSELDINELLIDLVELYEPLALDKNQKLNLTSSQLITKADRDLLFQALANILDNAVKYTPAGGEITLSARSLNDCLEINISDSGIGVPETELPKLMQRFYRVEQSRNLQGNGLGLSLVSAVLTLHQGSIHFTNNNPGLKVKLILPLTAYS